VLPAPRGTLAAVVDRLPAPLFAVLAAATLLGSDHGSGGGVWLAAAAALLTVRRRSLLLTVAAGLAGALVGQALA
jgi:hypothetical protein